jgi:DNA-directed RNA polymerase beta' subunit
MAQALVDGGLVSPDRIREWSYGELREPADLESQRVFGPVRSFWCACGRYRGRAYAGIVCRRCGVEVIHAASRRMRTGHIVLRTPVVHPWYAGAAAQLLGAPIDGMLVEELRVALLALDLDRIVEDVKREIVTAPKAKIADAAGRRLALVDAFRTARTQAYTQPVHVILDIVPVVPPHGELGCDRAPVRTAYARILEGEDPKAGIPRLFDALSAR